MTTPIFARQYARHSDFPSYVISILAPNPHSLKALSIHLLCLLCCPHLVCLSPHIVPVFVPCLSVSIHAMAPIPAAFVPPLPPSPSIDPARPFQLVPIPKLRSYLASKSKLQPLLRPSPTQSPLPITNPVPAPTTVFPACDIFPLRTRYDRTPTHAHRARDAPQLLPPYVFRPPSPSVHTGAALGNLAFFPCPHASLLLVLDAHSAGPDAVGAWRPVPAPQASPADGILVCGLPHA